MAVVNALESWSKATYEADTRGRRGTRVWTVETDSVDDGPVVATQASAIPRRGQFHPADPYLPCVGAGLGQVLSPTLFEIVARYELDYSNPHVTESPLEQPAIITVSTRLTTEPVDIDADGNPLLNAADESFDPPLQRQFSDVVISIRRNETGFYAGKVLAYTQTLNSRELWGWQPGILKLETIADEPRWHDDMEYYVVTYTIVGRTDGWKRRVLNQGFRKKVLQDGTWGGEYEQFTDANGQPLSEPKLLDADGDELTAGAEPVWLELPLYPEMDWTPLGLD